jgi:hypothetical protein
MMAGVTVQDRTFAGAAQLPGSSGAVERRIGTGGRGRYVRSAALVTLTVDSVPLRHALRDACPGSPGSRNTGHRVKISARRLRPPRFMGRDEA